MDRRDTVLAYLALGLAVPRILPQRTCEAIE